MAHTQSRYMQDLGFTDGKIFAGPGDIVVSLTAGTSPVVRVAAGQWNFTQAISSSVFYAVNMTQMFLRRLGFFEDLQEQFGGAGIAGSAQVRDYRPDVRPNMNLAQQLQPRTAFKPKGFRLLSYDVIYSNLTANPTTLTTRVDQTVFVNGAAPVTTVVLATGVNGLNPAFTANPYVTTVTPAVQPYFILNDAELWIELNVITPGGGTFLFWGFDVQVEFNYN